MTRIAKLLPTLLRQFARFRPKANKPQGNRLLEKWHGHSCPEFKTDSIQWGVPTLELKRNAQDTSCPVKQQVGPSGRLRWWGGYSKGESSVWIAVGFGIKSLVTQSGNVRTGNHTHFQSLRNDCGWTGCVVRIDRCGAEISCHSACGFPSTGWIAGGQSCLPALSQ